MKGINVWIWLIAAFIIGILMFTISLQFITYITTSQQKELARESLDELSTNINGLCSNRAGDEFLKTITFPEKVTAIYATKDVRLSPVDQRTYGNSLCMIFSNELICNDISCNLEMEKISSGENLQSLLNQFSGKFGTNSYILRILKTDCGVAVLPESSKTTCLLNNTLA